MSFEYWYMFPVAIVISTIALISGVGGATFFTPIFLLGLGLPLRVAIGAALITGTFGFASGLITYARRRLIDYRLAARLMAASMPMALVGVWLALRIDPSILRVILGLGLLLIASNFLRSPPAEAGVAPAALRAPEPRSSAMLGAAFAGAGGLSIAMISAGLGELNAYYLIKRRGMPGDVAVGTSVLVVAATIPVAASGHLIGFFRLGPETMHSVREVVLFTIPGVIIGAQVGCALASRVPREALIRLLGGLLAIVAVLVLAPVVF